MVVFTPWKEVNATYQAPFLSQELVVYQHITSVCVYSLSKEFYNQIGMETQSSTKLNGFFLSPSLSPSFSPSLSLCHTLSFLPSFLPSLALTSNVILKDTKKRYIAPHITKLYKKWSSDLSLNPFKSHSPLELIKSFPISLLFLHFR